MTEWLFSNKTKGDLLHTVIYQHHISSSKILLWHMLNHHLTLKMILKYAKRKITKTPKEGGGTIRNTIDTLAKQTGICPEMKANKYIYIYLCVCFFIMLQWQNRRGFSSGLKGSHKCHNITKVRIFLILKCTLIGIIIVMCCEVIEKWKDSKKI